MTQPPLNMPAILTLKALEIIRSNTTLLANINAAVTAGDKISLQGGSGSGKSLLLRAMTLLEVLQQGEIIWQGQTLRPAMIPHYRSQVIYLHQRPSLGSGTVEDCLRQVFSLKTHHGKTYSAARINTYLEEIGVNSGFLQKNLTDLSGGEVQVTALLRAIQLEPQILLLDEPTAALDASKAAVIEKIVDCWFAETADRRAYIWVTHNNEQAERVSNQVWTMIGGKLTSN